MWSDRGGRRQTGEAAPLAPDLPAITKPVCAGCPLPPIHTSGGACKGEVFTRPQSMPALIITGTQPKCATAILGRPRSCPYAPDHSLPMGRFHNAPDYPAHESTRMGFVIEGAASAACRPPTRAFSLIKIFVPFVAFRALRVPLFSS